MSHENEVSARSVGENPDGGQTPQPKIVFTPEMIARFKALMEGKGLAFDVRPAGVPIAVHGDEQELDPDLTNIVPRAEGYRYTHVEGEEEDRLKLLRKTMLDKHGFAVVESLDGLSVTRLAAVQVVDGDASLVPLRLSRGQLLMDMPDDKATQFGFFVGYDRSPVSAVVRAGEYPGIPLTTEQTNPKEAREILYRMGGIRENEMDEQRWAEQVGITELGFAPDRMRGIFDKSHRADPSTTDWTNRRLVSVPDEQRGLLPHFDSYYVAPDKIQILTYSARPPAPSIIIPRAVTTSSGDVPKRTMGLGFGSEYRTQATTSAGYTSRLAAAFDIRLSPKKTA